MKEKDPEPQIDESLLTPEQYEEMHRKRNYKPWIVFFASLAALMIVCVVVIAICKNL